MSYSLISFSILAFFVASISCNGGGDANPITHIHNNNNNQILRSKRETDLQPNEEKVNLLDFFLDNILTNTIRFLYKQNYIKRRENTRTPEIVDAIFTNCIYKMDFYNILINNRSDTELNSTIITDAFNNMLWWTELIEIDGELKPIIDVQLETFLSQILLWLCDNHWIDSDLEIETIVSVSLNYLKNQQNYLSFVERSDITGGTDLISALYKDHWWWLNGVIHKEGDTKHWQWESEITYEYF